MMLAGMATVGVAVLVAYLYTPIHDAEEEYEDYTIRVEAVERQEEPVNASVSSEKKLSPSTRATIIVGVTACSMALAASSYYLWWLSPLVYV